MAIRVICIGLTLCGLMPAAHAQGYPGYPYSIMTLEGGSRPHYRAVRHRGGSAPETAPTTAVTTEAATQPHRPSLLGREKFVAKLHRRGLYAARGSSGSVLPTPLPRTQLIPPEGGGTLTLPPLQQEQGPTRIPGTAQIIQNLPHGQETFQDRASRCTFSPGFMACREIWAISIWARVCSDALAARPRASGSPAFTQHSFWIPAYAGMSGQLDLIGRATTVN